MSTAWRCLTPPFKEPDENPRPMPRHQLRLDEDAYELLEAQREPGESFSDVIRRLLGPGPPGPPDLGDVRDAEAAETMEDVAETAGDEDVELNES